MTFNWFNRILQQDNQEEIKINEGGDRLIQNTIGTFTCLVCNHININPKMMDIDESDESKGSLIKCTSEQCDGKYVRWE